MVSRPKMTTQRAGRWLPGRPPCIYRSRKELFAVALVAAAATTAGMMVFLRLPFHYGSGFEGLGGVSSQSTASNWWWRHVVAAAAPGAPLPLDGAPGTYSEQGYHQIRRRLVKLTQSAQCRPILQIGTAQEMFRKAAAGLTSPNFYCGSNVCETWVIILTNRAKVTAATPQMYISGAVHGDERVGPSVVIEFIELMCNLYNRHPIITYLLDTRAIWLTPMTNAWGYFYNRRDELGIDPNRDFPYMRANGECMQSITARAVNELFRHTLFQLAITFHGGTRLLAYEWGSFDHSDAFDSVVEAEPKPLQRQKSREAPDARSQQDIARELQLAAGFLDQNHSFERGEWYGYRSLLASDRTPISLFNSSRSNGRILFEPFRSSPAPFVGELIGKRPDDPKFGEWFYRIGPMSDLVYPVDGGFEDWSYSASWQPSPHPISICIPRKGLRSAPPDFDYPSWKSIYTSTNSTRCSTFLIEADYLKAPPSWQYGHSREVFEPRATDGHIARNIRVILKLAEFLVPTILLAKPPRLEVLPKRLGIDEHTSLLVTVEPESTPFPARASSHRQRSKRPVGHIILELMPIGCARLSSADAVFLTGPCKANSSPATERPVRVQPVLHSSTKCLGIGLWEGWNLDSGAKPDGHSRWTSDSLDRRETIVARIAVYPEDVATVNGTCFKLRVSFDQHWGLQATPDPKVPPQTLIAKSRLEGAFQATSTTATINSTIFRYIPSGSEWGAAFADGIYLPTFLGPEHGTSPTKVQQHQTELTSPWIQPGSGSDNSFRDSDSDPVSVTASWTAAVVANRINVAAGDDIHRGVWTLKVEHLRAGENVQTVLSGWDPFQRLSQIASLNSFTSQSGTIDAVRERSARPYRTWRATLDGSAIIQSISSHWNKPVEFIFAFSRWESSKYSPAGPSATDPKCVVAFGVRIIPQSSRAELFDPPEIVGPCLPHPSATPQLLPHLLSAASFELPRAGGSGIPRQANASKAIDATALSSPTPPTPKKQWRVHLMVELRSPSTNNNSEEVLSALYRALGREIIVLETYPVLHLNHTATATTGKEFSPLSISESLSLGFPNARALLAGSTESSQGDAAPECACLFRSDRLPLLQRRVNSAEWWLNPRPNAASLIAANSVGVFSVAFHPKAASGYGLLPALQQRSGPFITATGSTTQFHTPSAALETARVKGLATPSFTGHLTATGSFCRIPFKGGTAEDILEIRLLSTANSDHDYGNSTTLDRSSSLVAGALLPLRVPRLENTVLDPFRDRLFTLAANIETRSHGEPLCNGGEVLGAVVVSPHEEVTTGIRAGPIPDARCELIPIALAAHPLLNLAVAGSICSSKSLLPLDSTNHLSFSQQVSLAGIATVTLVCLVSPMLSCLRSTKRHCLEGYAKMIAPEVEQCISGV